MVFVFIVFQGENNNNNKKREIEPTDGINKGVDRACKSQAVELANRRGMERRNPRPDQRRGPPPSIADIGLDNDGVRSSWGMIGHASLFCV